MILTMVLSATSSLASLIPLFAFFDVVGMFVLIPLHAYFDLLSGVVQTFVFCLLTMIYWKLETKEMGLEENENSNTTVNPIIDLNPNT